MLIRIFLVILCLLTSVDILAQPGLQAVTVTNTASGGQEYSITIQTIILMTVITLLPSMLLMMTSFTRIIIVLAILRQATGLMQAPSAQIIVGLGLFMTFFIMAPVFDRMYEDGVQPYMNEQIDTKETLKRMSVPIHEFMLAQTREKDLSMFSDIAKKGPYKNKSDVPFSIVIIKPTENGFN